MTRRQAREIAVMMVYAGEYGHTVDELLEEWLDSDFFEGLREEDELFISSPGEAEKGYIRKIISGVFENKKELDEQIAGHCRDWKINRLPLMALSVMRVCLQEILYMPEIPPNAAISEAVEISKHYDTKEVTAYLNGLLGSIQREVCS